MNKLINAKNILFKPLDPTGIFIGCSIIFLWFTSLMFLLNWQVNFTNPILYLAIYIQTHLYTGLFITSHDAMHGSVSKNKKINTTIGRISSLLFAFNFYDSLIVKHHKHHNHVATEEDPDYHDTDSFWLWYWSFIKRYITIKQLILITISLQLLRLIFPLENLLLYWVLPSILSTFQLFYFGTYIPHKEEHHHNKHKSGTLQKNHLLAFFSCYFFGYHYEHHDSPGIPWWRLWQVK